MPSKHNPKKKTGSEVSASQANVEQIQDQLAHYRTLAAALDANRDATQDEAILAPITNLDESTQLALVEKLGREQATESANVLQALYTYAPAKAVRKEARRSLIKLEGNNVYPTWEAPKISLLDTLPQSLFPVRQGEEFLDDEDDDDDLDELDFPAGLSEQLTNLLPVSPAEMAVSGALEAWARGDYSEVFDQLAPNSPLREQLTRDKWVRRRKQWHKAAQPQGMRIHFATSVQEEQGQAQLVEVGWSLAFKETETDAPLPELPVATIVFPETGRHWFWSRYRVINNRSIQDVIDEGAQALLLPEEDLLQRIEEVTQIANERLQELQEAELNLDEDDDEDDDEIVIDSEDQEEDFDDGEDDEEFEGEDILDIANMMGRVQEAFSITSVGLSYSDALIAQETVNDPSVYETPYNLANAMGDYERAAAYASIKATRLYERRGEALTELASSFALLASQYEEEDDSEQVDYYLSRAEESLREAVALSNEGRNKVLLAQVLIAQHKQFDEAEKLLHQARAEELDTRMETLADVGLAGLFQERGEYTQALDYYIEASTLQPDFPGLWLSIGHVQLELGRFDEAEQNLLRSIEQDPEAAQAYLELATIYNDHQHDLARAEFVLSQGLEAVPDSADLLAAQAIIFIQKGDLVQAEQFLEEAEEIDPEVELLQDARNMLLSKQLQQRQTRSESKQHKRKK